MSDNETIVVFHDGAFHFTGPVPKEGTRFAALSASARASEPVCGRCKGTRFTCTCTAMLVPLPGTSFAAPPTDAAVVAVLAELRAENARLRDAASRMKSWIAGTSDALALLAKQTDAGMAQPTPRTGEKNDG